MSYFDDAWLRNAYDALRAMFAVDAHVRNEIIEFLFDEGFWDRDKLTWDAAVAKYNANLNPNKAEAWKVGELMAIDERFDRPQLLEAWMTQRGYEIRRIPTEARRLMFLERIATATERCEAEVCWARAGLARLDRPEAPKQPIPLTGARPQFALADVVEEPVTPRNLP